MIKIRNIARGMMDQGHKLSFQLKLSFWLKSDLDLPGSDNKVILSVIMTLKIKR